MTTGERIKALRMNSELSQAKLGEIIGITQQSVYAWETGKTEPDIDAIRKMVSIFGITSDYLLGIDDTVAVINTDKKNPPTPKQRREIEEITSQALIGDPSFNDVVREAVRECIEKMFGASKQGGIDE
jgi:Predicted transcriptional regulators